MEGELHRKPKLSVFCALSIILYIFFEKLCNYLRGELLDKLKNGIRILEEQVVLELLIKTFNQKFNTLCSF